MTAWVRVWHWKRWLAIGIVALALAVFGGPFVYIHLVEGAPPPPLSLATPSSASSAADTTGSGRSTGSGDGTWDVTTGSVAGYRVKEVLFGQKNEAVGRTSEIAGSITIEGTTVSAGSFTVDMTAVTSDESRRDAQFNGRIMETAVYPKATFTLTEPIHVGATPAKGAQRMFQAKGNLTLHGHTRTVTFRVTAEYTGSTVRVVGSIPITFADWDIPNPSFGPVATEDHGVLEFALNFAHA